MAAGTQTDFLPLRPFPYSLCCWHLLRNQLCWVEWVTTFEHTNWYRRFFWNFAPSLRLVLDLFQTFIPAWSWYLSPWLIFGWYVAGLLILHVHIVVIAVSTREFYCNFPPQSRLCPVFFHLVMFCTITSHVMVPRASWHAR